MRGLLCGDWHCAHVVGLTPPKYNAYVFDPEDEDLLDASWALSPSLREARRVYWEWFMQMLEPYRPFDFAIYNGDLIDGKGKRQGGVELLTTDRNMQVRIAQEVADQIGIEQTYLSYGTPYHTGDEEDYELTLAEKIGAKKIGSHDWLDANGLIIDYRHHIGGSQVPHTRATALSRERLWNILWNERGEAFPKADLLIRSHVHYYTFVGGANWMAMTLPALQGLGSKYGARRMSGTVDFGFTVVDIHDKEHWTWKTEIMPWPKVEAEKVLTLEQLSINQSGEVEVSENQEDQPQ